MKVKWHHLARADFAELVTYITTDNPKVQLIAPIPLFEVSQKPYGGHFVTTVLLAILPMLITASSYGRMDFEDRSAVVSQDMGGCEQNLREHFLGTSLA